MEKQTHCARHSPCPTEICVSLPLICRWPKCYKATLPVSAAEKCMSYTGRGCKLHGNDWRFFSFSGRSENLRTVVQFSMEMKGKKLVKGLHVRQMSGPSKLPSEILSSDPKVPKLLLGQVCYVPQISYSVLSFSLKAKLLLMLFSRQVMSDSWQPQGLRHARLLVPNHLPEFAQVHVQ